VDKYLESGVKTDNNKPSMSLIDPDFLVGLAKVLDFGKEKYAAHNWRGGIKFSRLISAAYRHLGEINRGEDLDSESGLLHVYHLACCVMFLSWMMDNRNDLDDRWKGNNLEEQTLKLKEYMEKNYHKEYEGPKAGGWAPWDGGGSNFQPGVPLNVIKDRIWYGQVKLGV